MTETYPLQAGADPYQDVERQVAQLFARGHEPVMALLIENEEDERLVFCWSVRYMDQPDGVAIQLPQGTVFPGMTARATIETKVLPKIGLEAIIALGGLRDRPLRTDARGGSGQSKRWLVPMLGQTTTPRALHPNPDMYFRAEWLNIDYVRRLPDSTSRRSRNRNYLLGLYATLREGGEN